MLDIGQVENFYLFFKEQALVRYSVDKLSASGFELISVPEILPPEVIEGCGMNTSGGRTQVCEYILILPFVLDLSFGNVLLRRCSIEL